MSYNKTSAPASPAAVVPNVATLQLENKRLKRDLQLAISDREEAESNLADFLSNQGALSSGEAALSAEAKATLESERDQAVRAKDQAIAERDQALADKAKLQESYADLLQDYTTAKQYLKENNLPRRLSHLEQLRKNVQQFCDVQQHYYARRQGKFDQLSSMVSEKLLPLILGMASDHAEDSPLLRLPGLLVAKSEHPVAEGSGASPATQGALVNYEMGFPTSPSAPVVPITEEQATKSGNGHVMSSSKSSGTTPKTKGNVAPPITAQSPPSGIPANQNVLIGEHYLPFNLGRLVLQDTHSSGLPLRASRYQTGDIGSPGALPGLQISRRELPSPKPGSEPSGAELQDFSITPFPLTAHPKDPRGHGLEQESQQDPRNERQESITTPKEPEMTVKQGKQPESRPFLSEQPSQKTPPPSASSHDSADREKQQHTSVPASAHGDPDKNPAMSYANDAATSPKERRSEEFVHPSALRPIIPAMIFGDMLDIPETDEQRAKRLAEREESWQAQIREHLAWRAAKLQREKEKAEKEEKAKGEGTQEQTPSEPGRKRKQQQLEMDSPAQKRRR